MTDTGTRNMYHSVFRSRIRPALIKCIWSEEHRGTMAERIDPNDRIGTYSTEVLENLKEWLDQENTLSDGQTEVVQHIVERPETHKRDINAIVEEEITYRSLRTDFDSNPPNEWGFPADTWETAERIHELRTETDLEDREATVRALTERDRSCDEIAAMLNISKFEVDDYSDWINQ